MNNKSHTLKPRDFFLCFLSSVLLTLSFPKFEIWTFAWVALIPFMFALDGKKKSHVFLLGFSCGFAFFSAGLLWLMNLTSWFGFIVGFGVILLFLYLSLFFGCFALLYNYFKEKKVIFKLFLIPSGWVTLELIRDYLFTGFGWLSLGHSQYKNLIFIQIADITGVLGVSFIIVMVNFILKQVISALGASISFKNLSPFKDVRLPALLTIMLVLIVVKYGTFRLSERASSSKISVAVIQGNISQDLKWKERSWQGIVKKHLMLTDRVAKKNPQLIIWPETSMPGILSDQKEFFEEIQGKVREIKTPLLFGVVTKTKKDYYNSAVLLSEHGKKVKQYNKVHLVPFGEYVPLRSFLPFLSELIPISDFSSGDEYTVFPFAGETKHFAVLICFEDTVSRVAREFVRNGAKILINITNDAWFKDTTAPFMHLQCAVFRTIENRRSLVRAANTGVSCFIDPYGRIKREVRSYRGKKTYIPGSAIESVSVSDRYTFYTRFGEVFALLCAACVIAGSIKKRK